MEQALCELCDEPMPKGEEMFKYHGYSCDCPKKVERSSTTNQDRGDSESGKPDKCTIWRKTVEWYADPDNWDTQTEMPRKAYDDHGKRARLALDGKCWYDKHMELAKEYADKGMIVEANDITYHCQKRWEAEFDRHFTLSTDNGTGPMMLFKIIDDEMMTLASPDHIKDFIRGILDNNTRIC